MKVGGLGGEGVVILVVTLNLKGVPEGIPFLVEFNILTFTGVDCTVVLLASDYVYS